MSERETIRRRPKGHGYLLLRLKGKWYGDREARNLKGGKWYACYVSDGRTVRESSKGTRQNAADLLKKRLREIDEGTFIQGAARLTLGQLRDLVVADYAAKGRRSAKRVGGLFKNLTRILGESTRVEKIAQRIPEYIATRLDEKRPTRAKVEKETPEKKEAKERRTISRATVNRELAALRRGYRLAKKANMLARVPDIEKLDEGPPRKGFPEPEEIEAIIGKLPERLRGPILFLGITGWRVREVLNLEWRSVDLKAGTIRLESDETKGGEIREYPYAVHPELKTLIHSQRAAADAWEREHGEIVRPVFWHPSHDENGRPTASRNRAYQHAWSDACREAGRPGRLVHDLRRYAARNLVRAGVSEQVSMELLGHKTPSVFRRYNITDQRDRREGVERLAHAQSERRVSRRANG
jgi:integrase